jgi:hypothetical protein
MALSPSEVTSIPTVQNQPESRHSVSQSRSRYGSDVLEATELSRIRSNYSRATDSYRAASGSIARASPTGVWRWKHAIYQFWKGQISIIVAHEACRDHLGMYAITIYLIYHVYFRLAHRSVQGLQSWNGEGPP